MNNIVEILEDMVINSTDYTAEMVMGQITINECGGIFITCNEKRFHSFVHLQTCKHILKGLHELILA